MSSAPVLFFAFRRPLHTRRVLESLAKNYGSGDVRLFAFIDGPRDDSDVRLSDEVEAVLRSERWCGQVTICRREINLGCAESVMSTVGQYVEDYGTVIVLEDDNYLSPHFLTFINNALIRYKDSQRVMEVSGYRYPVNSANPRSGFTQHAIGWGWATWKRAWDKFDTSGERLLGEILSSPDLVSRFNLDGAFNFVDMLRQQVAGRIGGWDIRWSANILLNDGLSLYPSHSLVNNIGLDGSGTNCGATDIYENVLKDTPVLDLPEDIEVDKVFHEELRRYYRAVHESFLRRIWRYATSGVRGGLGKFAN